MNKQILKQTLCAWLPLAIVTVIFAGLIYKVEKQNYRQNANDPQIQIAQDVADAILQGAPPESIAPPVGSTDIKKSLSPFIIILDGSGKVVASTAILNEKNPEYPISVLEQAKATGEHRVTWQPEPGVRIATVVTYYSEGEQSGYIVVGRSLKEVDKRVQKLTAMTASAAAAALILSLIVIFLFKKFYCKNSEQLHQHTEIVIDSTKEV